MAPSSAPVRWSRLTPMCREAWASPGCSGAPRVKSRPANELGRPGFRTAHAAVLCAIVRRLDVTGADLPRLVHHRAARVAVVAGAIRNGAWQSRNPGGLPLLRERAAISEHLPLRPEGTRWLARGSGRDPGAEPSAPDRRIGTAGLPSEPGLHHEDAAQGEHFSECRFAAGPIHLQYSTAAHDQAGYRCAPR